VLAQGVPAFTPATTVDADLKDLSLVMDHNMSVASFNAAPAYLPKPAPAKVSSNSPASLMQNDFGWCLILEVWENLVDAQFKFKWGQVQCTLTSGNGPPMHPCLCAHEILACSIRHTRFGRRPMSVANSGLFAKRAYSNTSP
jgi:hypothetical protein